MRRTALGFCLALALLLAGCTAGKTGGSRSEQDAIQHTPDGTDQWIVEDSFGGMRRSETIVPYLGVGTISGSLIAEANPAPGAVVGIAATLVARNASGYQEPLGRVRVLISADGIGAGAWANGVAMEPLAPLNDPTNPGIAPSTEFSWRPREGGPFELRLAYAAWGPTDPATIRVSLHVNSTEKDLLVAQQRTTTDRGGSGIGVISSRDARSDPRTQAAAKVGIVQWQRSDAWTRKFETTTATYFQLIASGTVQAGPQLAPGTLTAKLRNETEARTVTLGFGHAQNVWTHESASRAASSWNVQVDVDGPGRFSLVYADFDLTL